MNIRKPMAVTPRKLEANRRNAQKSTGPQTANGNAISKMNALKHGLLAQTVVVRGHKLKESNNEFNKLCQEFYLSLAPVGPLEEMLVGQIVTATWRLRRARTAESGEIALSVDGGWWQREKQNPLIHMLAFPILSGTEGLVTELKQTVWGCRYLIHCLSDLRYAVERDGELTEAALKTFTEQNLRGCPGSLGEKLEQLRAWLAANPEKLEPEALRARHKAEVLKCLNPEIRDSQYWLERNQKREDAEEQARQAAGVLPSEATLDKILRYETALLRQRDQAMNQLERLQRRRLGENIPALVTMDISARG
jgi:hypothetical protein